MTDARKATPEEIEEALEKLRAQEGKIINMMKELRNSPSLLDAIPDSEKLQALIELAWKNGYEFRDDAVFATIGHNVSLLENSIIFSHDFIKALCRAKWGTLSMREHDACARCGNDHQWETHLKELAISPDRISYLYDTFMEEK